MSRSIGISNKDPTLYCHNIYSPTRRALPQAIGTFAAVSRPCPCSTLHHAPFGSRARYNRLALAEVATHSSQVTYADMFESRSGWNPENPAESVYVPSCSEIMRAMQRKKDHLQGLSKLWSFPATLVQAASSEVRHERPGANHVHTPTSAPRIN